MYWNKVVAMELVVMHDKSDPDSKLDNQVADKIDEILTRSRKEIEDLFVPNKCCISLVLDEGDEK